MLTSSQIKSAAPTFGFDLCGVAAARKYLRLDKLRQWIDAGYAGDMHYLAASADERSDPAAVLPTVKSIVSLAVNYQTANPRSADLSDPERVAISRYAWGADYHTVLRNRLRRFVRWLRDEAGPGFEAFSCVDSGPVQERVYAEQAGLGWIGKNTCVINPRLGSWLFLAEVLTNLDLDTDAPAFDHCGSCTRCIDACPTGALVVPYTLDATRCLSYLTIESRGSVDTTLRAAITAQVYGCDICQDVCPWNRRAPASDDDAWQPQHALAFPKLMDLCRMSDDDWRRVIKDSAMRRAGVRRIRRSLAYAAAPLPEDDRDAALDLLSAHPSAMDTDVRDAIEWSRSVGGGASTAQHS